MAKCKLLMQTAQTQELIDFFDGYEDDSLKKLESRLKLNVKQNLHQMKQLDIVRAFLKRHLMEQFYTSLFNQMDSSDNKDVSPYFFIYDKSKN